MFILDLYMSKTKELLLYNLLSLQGEVRVAPPLPCPLPRERSARLLFSWVLGGGYTRRVYSARA